jgi:GT2 family glycosyltransferase
LLLVGGGIIDKGVSLDVIVSVVLGTFNRLAFLKLAINSIRRELGGLKHEIIVVDGGSRDGTIGWLAKQKDIITILQHNHGKWNGAKIAKKSWGYFMNLGFKCSQGKYICMLSDDCLVVPGSIKKGYDYFEMKLAENSRTGALAFFWRNWPEQHSYHIRYTAGNVLFVNHGMFLRAALEDVGFIDEKTYKFYHADSDLGIKLQQSGYYCIGSPDSYIEHFSHTNGKIRNMNNASGKADWESLFKKWNNIIYSDGKLLKGYIIQKDFFDETRTADQFKKFYYFFMIQKILKKIMQGSNLRKGFGLLFGGKYKQLSEKILKHQ